MIGQNPANISAVAQMIPQRLKNSGDDARHNT